jgi:hypothetical protein
MTNHHPSTVPDSTSTSEPGSGTEAKPVASPLTLVMTAKSEDDSRALVGLVNHIQSLPPDQNPVWSALNKLSIVHFARFVFLDDNMKLAVITTYDGSFEDYLNDFVETIGDVFNQLLSHVKDAPPLPVQTYRNEFHEYVKKNDLTCIPPFYSAYPNLTVLDIQALSGS